MKRQEIAQPWDLPGAPGHPKDTKREHKKALGSWALSLSKLHFNLQTYNLVVAPICSLRSVAARRLGTCKISFVSVMWFTLHSVSLSTTGTTFCILLLKMVAGSYALICQVCRLDQAHELEVDLLPSVVLGFLQVLLLWGWSYSHPRGVWKEIHWAVLSITHANKYSCVL